MKDFDQILTSLNLSTSDTREDSLKSIVKTALFEIGEPCSIKELKDFIVDIYGFEPYNQEFTETIHVLDDLGELQVGDKIDLTSEEREKLKKLEFQAKKEEEKRCNNFKTFLREKYKIEVSAEDYDILWKAFLQYLYQCFFLYGEKANGFISEGPAYDVNQKFNNTDILYSVLSDINRLDLADSLKFSVDNFNDFATSEDIDFIDSLGQKTLSFSSLGLDPAVAEDGFDKELIDWVLFLDTNFLFSVLDLHANVEDEACKELLKLLTNNPNYIKVKLYYSDLTLIELKHKKVDFKFIEESLTKPAIRALLKSDELDEFSRRYYEGLLKDPERTLHPTQVVDLADITLRGQSMEIYNTSVQRNFLGEEFLNVKVVEYQRFINTLNDIRREYYKTRSLARQPRELFRSESQKEHDITLREIIFLLRNAVKKKAPYKSLNQAKYFGATLDELLIRFDSSEIRKKGMDEYPTFFKPSYLLNKFIKLLPVKTDNYKKAFIKAVSARGFHKDTKKSNDVIRIVKYLKSQGIDNEDILLNLITEKVFLDKYREESLKDEFNEKDFVETEINRLYATKIDELSATKVSLNKLTIESEEDKREKIKLSNLKDHKEEQVKLYSKMIEKLQHRVTTLEGKIGSIDAQPTINFDAESEKARSKQLQSQLVVEKEKRLSIENKLRKPERDKYIKKLHRRWKQQALIYFGLSITPLLAYIAVLYFTHANQGGSFVTYIKNSQTVQSAFWLLMVIVNLITGKLVYDRFFNESFKKIHKEGIEIPTALKELKTVDDLRD